MPQQPEKQNSRKKSAGRIKKTLGHKGDNHEEHNVPGAIYMNKHSSFETRPETRILFVGNIIFFYTAIP